MNTVVTFDLQDASAAEYETAYERLASLGLYPSAPSDTGGRIHLPSTTCVGERTETAPVLRDWVWTQFDNARLRPKRVFVAKFDGWAATSAS